jgi:hypothetical protein
MSALSTPWIGFALPFRSTVETMLPPATPKLSGSSLSRESLSRMWVENASIGSCLGRWILSALSVTSASILAHAAVPNSASGRIRLLATRCCALAFCSAEAVSPASVLGGAPISGPRSSKSSSFDCRLALRKDRPCGGLVKVRSPRRSLSPTLPANLLKCQSLPSCFRCPRSV